MIIGLVAGLGHEEPRDVQEVGNNGGALFAVQILQDEHQLSTHHSRGVSAQT